MLLHITRKRERSLTNLSPPLSSKSQNCDDRTNREDIQCLLVLEKHVLSRLGRAIFQTYIRTPLISAKTTKKGRSVNEFRMQLYQGLDNDRKIATHQPQRAKVKAALTRVGTVFILGSSFCLAVHILLKVEYLPDQPAFL